MDRRPAKRRAVSVLNPDTPLAALLSAGQRRVLHAIAARSNVFLTGRAGCGKTATIEVLCAALAEAGTPYAVTATTGIAASALPGGTTVNSFLCMHPGGTLAQSVARAAAFRERICRPEVLVIDEVSMASAEMMETALKILQALRGARMPVLLLSGDFLQLGSAGGGKPLLGSAVWDELYLVNVVLADSWRQTNQAPFLRALDNARMGALSEADVALFRSRMLPAPSMHGVFPTFLTPSRKAAAAMNEVRMATLPGKAHVLPGAFHVYRQLPGDAAWAPFVDSVPRLGPMGLPLHAPPQYARRDDLASVATAWAKRCGADVRLCLKVGAQVVFIANFLPPAAVNGTRGVVTSIPGDGTVHVRTYGGVDIMATPFPFRREVEGGHPFRSDEEEPLSVVFAQIPLVKAWGLTVHKAQGMSLDTAEVDIGHGVFAAGQAYVALSRVRTLEGLFLANFNVASVWARPAVAAWYRRVSKASCW